MSLPGSEIKCPFCARLLDGALGIHIKQQHGEGCFRQAVLMAKAQGMPDVEIGERYGVSFRQLEQIITEACGANLSVIGGPRRIRSWEPKDFRKETTTVWSFRQRGNWATHDGRYRGNWSPYIPRNVIVRYSRPGDIVLDYFVGGGTTAVEAKLLGRRCVVKDINPEAVALTREAVAFTPPPQLFDGPYYEPEVSVGDARDLSDIPSDSIDLICAHPPYAGIIRYSSRMAGDVSNLSIPDFLEAMGQVARESWRVLKPGGKCVILIGDSRKAKRVVPIGFQTIRVFLDAGFALQELVIKRQHRCKATGFWYNRSVQHNFLLLAHEYLPVFEKPKAHLVADLPPAPRADLSYQAILRPVDRSQGEKLETTTMWIFPGDRLEAEIRRNVQHRFSIPGSDTIEVHFPGDHDEFDIASGRIISFVHVHLPRLVHEAEWIALRTRITEITEQAARLFADCGFLILQTEDTRVGGVFYPVGLWLYEEMAKVQEFALREIIIVAPQERPENPSGEHLEIVHRYLLVYAYLP